MLDDLRLDDAQREEFGRCAGLARPANRRVLGCLLANLRAMRVVCERRNALIVEDNVRPLLEGASQSVLSVLDDACDLLYLGHLAHADTLQRIPRGLADAPELTADGQNHELWGTYAYRPSSVLYQAILKYIRDGFPKSLFHCRRRDCDVVPVDKLMQRVARREGLSIKCLAPPVMYRMPPVHDRKKVMGAIKDYGKKLGESVAVQSLKTTGTAMVADLTNHLGALPVRNFSSGQLTGADDGPLKMGGDFIRELNSGRGGETSHACMPGCLIKCSNVYVDDSGRELVSPLEYETIGLLGTNCGLTEPDDVARLNETANDLGVDSIELGATIAVLMEAGEGAFGDLPFMQACLEEIRSGSEKGRLYASGTARVGAALKVSRVPVIKQQAISAYDPRVIEVTGISMMLTAQGADHTVGNAPSFKCDDKSIAELVAESLRMQINSAVADSFGLCVFGRTVTDDNLKLIADAINDAFDAGVDPEFIRHIALETLRLEAAFNKAAGFDDDDDELPAFFTDEPLPPTGKTNRLFSQEVNQQMQALLASATMN